MFDRICEYGKFTEKDASNTIRQVLDAVDYLHYNNVVHRGMPSSLNAQVAVLNLLADLKPENLLYLTKDPQSQLVLADFGIAKMLDTSDEVLTTMAGSFGYAAPEVMLKRGHGKPVDMWSLGVITYTLLCGYSPFRSENLPDLIEECKQGRIVFHDRYWRDVSKEAKDFINRLLQPDPNRRATSEEALQDIWIVGDTATDHNILPELRAYMAKARLRRGIEIIKLANRIEQLKIKEDEEEDVPGEGDVPANAQEAAGRALNSHSQLKGLSTSELPRKGTRLSKAARGAIFREVVLAKVREMKEMKERDTIEASARSASR